jgi:hypothetical protein
MDALTFAVLVSAVITFGVSPTALLASEEGKSLWQPYYIAPRSGAQHVSLAGKWDLGFRDAPITGLEDLREQLKWISAGGAHIAFYVCAPRPRPHPHRGAYIKSNVCATPRDFPHYRPKANLKAWSTCATTPGESVVNRRVSRSYRMV